MQVYNFLGHHFVKIKTENSDLEKSPGIKM